MYRVVKWSTTPSQAELITRIPVGSKALAILAYGHRQAMPEGGETILAYGHRQAMPEVRETKGRVSGCRAFTCVRRRGCGWNQGRQVVTDDPGRSTTGGRAL